MADDEAVAGGIAVGLVPFDAGREGWRMGAGPEALFDGGLRLELERRGLDLRVDLVRPGTDWATELRTTFDLHHSVAEDGSTAGGVTGMKSLGNQLRSLTSDLDLTIEVGPLVDADHVVRRWVATGHYGGGLPGAGAPVGTAVTFHGTDILRVADRHVVEYWLNGDSLDLMTQLQVGAG